MKADSVADWLIAFSFFGIGSTFQGDLALLEANSLLCARYGRYTNIHLAS